MRHCLPCKATYERIEQNHCPDCGGRLLSDEEKQLWLVAQEELTNQSFVPAHVLEGPVEEAILTEMLGEAGIAWMLRGHRADGFMATFRSQRGWGVLLVPEEDLQAAQVVVKSFKEATVTPYDPDADPGSEG